MIKNLFEIGKMSILGFKFFINTFRESFKISVSKSYKTRTKIVHKNVSQYLKCYHSEKVFNRSDFKQNHI